MPTSAELFFEELRIAMLSAGYDKSHQALQALARLRKAMREHGYKFSPEQSVQANVR